MIKSVGFFLLSFLCVGFGQPAWIPFAGPLAASLGYALFWVSLDQVVVLRRRFWIAALWFFLVQLVQISWMASTKYQGLYIVAVYLLLSIVLGLQFGWITKFVFFCPTLSLRSVFAIAAFATLSEWLRLFFFCGFTFNFAGMALACYVPSMQLASIFGVFGLSYLVFFSNALFLKAYRGSGGRGWWVWMSIALFPYCFGLVSLGFSNKKNEGLSSLNALLIQPGLSPSQKTPLRNFLHDFIPLNTQWRDLFLLASSYRLRDVDLVVFPESVVFAGFDSCIYPLPHVLDQLNAFGVDIERALPTLSAPYGKKISGNWFVSNAFWCQVLANHLESQVIAGFDQTDKGSGKHYNAAFYFTPYSEKISRYEKQILLPLAETLPWSFLKNITKRYGITEFFTPGSFSKLLGKDLQAGVSICIEETFPSIMRDARRRGARFFVNLTNDGWYPNTNLPMQHCSHSKIRAVENGVYLLRACNTGVTCFIDHKGRVLSQLPAQSWTGSPEKGALFQRVVLEVENTLYTYWGDVVIVGFCVVSLLIFLIGLGYGALFHIL